MYIKQNFLNCAFFYSAIDVDLRNPRTLIQSIAQQLSQRYPEYRNAIRRNSNNLKQYHINVQVNMQNVKAGRDITGSKFSIFLGDVTAEDAFDQLIRKPLKILCEKNPNEPVLILIDGLDEVINYGGRINVISMLAKIRDIPQQVRFILAARDDERIKSEFIDKGIKLLELSSGEFDSYNSNDISQYVTERVNKEEELAFNVLIANWKT